MTRARKKLIDLASTSYYHLISRCVRRAFLCGDDKYTGKNFDHRREWLVDRHLKGEQLDKPSLLFFNEIIAKWRERLYDISWYMKNLNEYIAREANKEDNCTGKYYSLPSLALTLRAA